MDSREQIVVRILLLVAKFIAPELLKADIQGLANHISTFGPKDTRDAR